MKGQKVKCIIKRDSIWVMIGLVSTSMLLLFFCISGHAQDAEEYKLFVGEFENRADITNPLLSYLTDTLNFLFSRSELAKIHPIPPGVRSAYLQWAQNERPDADTAQLALLAAEYAEANAVLLGSYTKSGAQWKMETQLYVMHGDSWIQENIQITGEDMYRLLEAVAVEVSKRLKAGQHKLLSTKSWEAYEAYRNGHQAYYQFDTTRAMEYFQKAIELNPLLAIAHAELGVSYLMINNLKDAESAFASAMKNLQYAGEYEQFVVKGLESYYRLAREAWTEGNDIAELPRMRDDTAWDEPWLYWHIGQSSKDVALRDSALKRWLDSTVAYTKAGFYRAEELAYTGTERCVLAFVTTSDQRFLNSAIQFIKQAADLQADDWYDDAWKYWELASIYGRMEKPQDVRKNCDNWLQEIKRKPIDTLSPETLDDIAMKCLNIGAASDAEHFASRAVELEADMSTRIYYSVTLAGAHLASGKLINAFSGYLEAVDAFASEDIAFEITSDSFSKLAMLVRDHPELIDEARRVKLNEIMNAIRSMDPLRFLSHRAMFVMHASNRTRGLVSLMSFCRAMGDMSPVLGIFQGLLKAEKVASEQLVYLSVLVSLNGGVSEFERSWFSSPDFIKAVTDLNDPMKLGWTYEMMGERRNAIKAYQKALESDSLETRILADCALLTDIEQILSRRNLIYLRYPLPK